MKIYSVALLLATFAYAEDTTEEEVVEDEPFMQSADFAWVADTTVTETKGDGFSTSVPSEAKGPFSGFKGSYTIKEDDNGKAWISVTMQSGWPTAWQSNGDYNSYNGNLAMTIQGMDTTATAEDGTETTVGYWEWATISASRNTSDKPKGTGKSLQWGDLVQGAWSDPGALDWGKTGAAAFVGSTDDVISAWEVTGDVTEQRKDDKKKKKRYITGMGASAKRMLDAGDASNIMIKNQEKTPFCASSWVNNDSGKYGWGWRSCSSFFVDMPVPAVPRDPVIKTGEGAANLAASFLAVAALFALNY